MCDTLVALGNSTIDGSVIFGKNSDRPHNEPQLITYSPRIRYPKVDLVKCTYIEIPQVKETFAVILSQPWWMWGAEMGSNEYGVVIGNEAVYTHEVLRDKGLLGMDLLRLGLERGKNADEAMKIIINLLEKYGQGGSCAYDDPYWMYHNSFIIVDPKEAYVLETAGKWWVIEKVKNVRSISNNLTIRGKGEQRKSGIIQHAIEEGYCTDDNDFDFALTFSDFSIPSIPSPYSRAGKATIILNTNKGQITPELMMNTLREHQAGICMHGGFESTGSQVSHLRYRRKSIHWFTGTTLPCVSIYKPYMFPIEGQKYYNPGPYQSINSEWFWYKHTKSKPINKKSELEKIEKIIISKVNDLILHDDMVPEHKFNEEMKILNLEAWNKSYELIK
ncbi:MAG: peptidase C69 [Candidatus Odinarchaeota archaeon]